MNAQSALSEAQVYIFAPLLLSLLSLGFSSHFTATMWSGASRSQRLESLSLPPVFP